jgi:hypothetical protein
LAGALGLAAEAAVLAGLLLVAGAELELELQAASSATAAIAVPGTSNFFNLSVIAYTPAS